MRAGRKERTFRIYERFVKKQKERFIERKQIKFKRKGEWNYV